MKPSSLLAQLSLLLWGMLLSSCYYSSPVPVSGDKLPIAQTLVGDWEAVDANSAMRLHINAPKRGVSTGYFTFEEVKDGKTEQELHTIELFETDLNGRRLLNVGLDLKSDSSAGYLFGEYKFFGDSLSFAFIKDDAFKKEAGDIWHTEVGAILRLKLIEMMKTMHDTAIFERREPMLLSRKMP